MASVETEAGTDGRPWDRHAAVCAVGRARGWVPAGTVSAQTGRAEAAAASVAMDMTNRAKSDSLSICGPPGRWPAGPVVFIWAHNAMARLNVPGMRHLSGVQAAGKPMV